ncbi:MAG: SAM-dependent chlorinase/fluorinase [Nanoarchaeota archaeon]
MIVLMTDFGQSEYVGVMKGVIRSRTEAEILDLTHQLFPQQITQAAWLLFKNFASFPKKTIFCVVVDPGVGSGRKAILVKTKNYSFIGPDNGVLWPAASKDGINAIYEIPIKEASKTFHGRDVFAPAAASLDKGTFKGKRISEMQKRSFHQKDREGIVVHVDHFGNVITTLHHSGKQSYEIKTETFHDVLPFHDNYASAQEGLFLIKGSGDTLEISMKEGNAQSIMTASIGQKIRIT